jgi:hypothetical protein
MPDKTLLLFAHVTHSRISPQITSAISGVMQLRNCSQWDKLVLVEAKAGS